MTPFQTEFVIFDVETTGLSPLNGDKIIEIAAVKLKDNKIVDTFESLINPRRGIPIEAQRVHGITPELVLNAPDAESVLPQVLSFIGSACLIGHNIKFDLDFLCYELSLIGRKLKDETPALDTLKMSKKLMAHLRTHRLSHLAHSFGIQVNETHRAMADVKLTVSVWKCLLDVGTDQGLGEIQGLIKEFSVQKPNFRLADTQALLF